MRVLHSAVAPVATRPLRLAVGAFWFMAAVLLAFVAAPRVRAQTAATDAQKSEDVRLLIANDAAAASLRQQLATRAITNVEYTKQAQELTKARNAILARYDRNAQRDFIALYNAAKADIAQAAADARRKAAAEAQAKLVADREAAKKTAADAQAKMVADREAAKKNAAKEAEAKAETARQAVAAQAKALEDDAQNFTKLALRHDELVFKESMKTLTPAERASMPALASEGAEIKKKYAAGGASATRGAEFQKRLAELSQQIIQPASRVWATAAFPEPARVTADFSTEGKRAAAFIYLTQLLSERIAAPQPDATREKILGYQRALGAINAAYNSPFTPKAQEAHALAKNADFRLEVASKYLPIFVAGVQAEVAQARARAEAEKAAAAEKALGQRLSIGLTVIGLGLFALPLAVLFLKGEKGPRVTPENTASEALPLPPELRRVSVFKKDYEVVCDSGLVYDREIWTETNVTTTTSGGGNYVSGGTVYSQPSTTTTHVSTTVYHRYWMRRLDGREVWRRFSDDVFQASKGQVISTIDCGLDVLMAYNHSTGQFATSKGWFAGANRLRGRRLLGYNLGAWAVLYVAFALIMSTSPLVKSSAIWGDIPLGGTLTVAIISAIYIAILKAIVQIVRNAQFNRKYVPAFRQHLQGASPAVLKRFSDALAAS